MVRLLPDDRAGCERSGEMEGRADESVEGRRGRGAGSGFPFYRKGHAHVHPLPERAATCAHGRRTQGKIRIGTMDRPVIERLILTAESPGAGKKQKKYFFGS